MKSLKIASLCLSVYKCMQRMLSCNAFILQDGESAEGEEEGKGKLVEAVSSSEEKPKEGIASLQGKDLLVNGKPAEALVNGVSPDLNAPLAWLHANFHSADFFLYIVVAVRE